MLVCAKKKRNYNGKSPFCKRTLCSEMSHAHFTYSPHINLCDLLFPLYLPFVIGEAKTKGKKDQTCRYFQQSVNGLDSGCPFCAQGHRKKSGTSGCGLLVARASLCRALQWTIRKTKQKSSFTFPVIYFLSWNKMIMH